MRSSSASTSPGSSGGEEEESSEETQRTDASPLHSEEDSEEEELEVEEVESPSEEEGLSAEEPSVAVVTRSAAEKTRFEVQLERAGAVPLSTARAAAAADPPQRAAAAGSSAGDVTVNLLREQLAWNKLRVQTLQRELDAQQARGKMMALQVSELSGRRGDRVGDLDQLRRGHAEDVAHLQAEWTAKLKRVIASERRGAEQLRTELLAAVATSAAKAAAADHVEALQRQTTTHREKMRALKGQWSGRLAHAAAQHDEALQREVAAAVRIAEERARIASEKQQRAFNAEIAQVLARVVDAQTASGTIDFSSLQPTAVAAAAPSYASRTSSSSAKRFGGEREREWRRPARRQQQQQQQQQQQPKPRPRLTKKPSPTASNSVRKGRSVAAKRSARQSARQRRRQQQTAVSAVKPKQAPAPAPAPPLVEAKVVRSQRRTSLAFLASLNEERNAENEAATVLNGFFNDAFPESPDTEREGGGSGSGSGSESDLPPPMMEDDEEEEEEDDDYFSAFA